MRSRSIEHTVDIDELCACIMIIQVGDLVRLVSVDLELNREKRTYMISDFSLKDYVSCRIVGEKSQEGFPISHDDM